MSICTFIGHRNCPETIIPVLYETIESLIQNKGITKFYVGTNGDFDRIVYALLCEIESRYNIEVYVVLAYLKQMKEYRQYDQSKTLFPDVLTKTPPQFAINRRNQYMIDKAQYVITYMNNTFSNTYSVVDRAIKKGITVINVGSFDISKMINNI